MRLRKNGKRGDFRKFGKACDLVALRIMEKQIDFRKLKNG